MAISEHMERVRQRLRMRGHAAFPGAQAAGPSEAPATNEFGELVEELDLEEPDLPPVGTLLEPMMAAPTEEADTSSESVKPRPKGRPSAVWTDEMRAAQSDRIKLALAVKRGREGAAWNTITDLPPIRVKRTPVRKRKRPTMEPSRAGEMMRRFNAVHSMLRSPPFRDASAIRSQLLAAGLADLLVVVRAEVYQSRIIEVRALAPKFDEMIASL